MPALFLGESELNHRIQHVLVQSITTIEAEVTGNRYSKFPNTPAKTAHESVGFERRNGVHLPV